MTNKQAVFALCNAICNTFYPDDSAIAVTLLTYGLEADDSALAKDPNVFRSAKSLVLGYVEGSRSENGVATSVRSDDAVKRALRHWCNEFGLDTADELDETLNTLESGSNLW